MTNGGTQADAEGTHTMPRLMAIMKATTIAITGARAIKTAGETSLFLTVHSARIQVDTEVGRQLPGGRQRHALF